MKITFSIVLFLLLGFSQLYAQSFNAELSVGLSANQINGDDLSGFNKPGFVAGAGVGFPIHENWMIKSELFFIQKGSKSTSKDPFFLIWRSSYLEIPFVISFNFAERFYAEAGVAGDVLISSKVDGGGGFYDVSDEMSTFHPVTIFGFGYALSEKLLFKARHSYSITSFSPYSGKYNNSIAVYLSYILNK